MFGIGGFEFLVICIAAILFIGPKDIPNLLYALGKMMRQFQRTSQSFRDGFSELTKDAALNDIISDANKAGDEMMDFRIAQQVELEKQKAKPSKPKPKTKKKTTTKKATSSKKKKGPS